MHQGKVSSSIEENGVVSRGQGRHTDVVQASALAVVNALNQQAYQRQLERAQVGSAAFFDSASLNTRDLTANVWQ